MAAFEGGSGARRVPAGHAVCRPWPRAAVVRATVLAVGLLVGGAAGAGLARGETAPQAGSEVPAELAHPPPARAPVIVDGETLFLVRGTSAHPAAERARAIAERIRAVAADPSVAPEQLEVVDPPGEPWTRIVVGDVVIATIYEADARAEQVMRRTLATSVLRRIREAIVAYREERRPEVLARRAAYALGLSVLAVLLGWGVLRASARFEAGLERRFRDRVRGLEEQSFRLIRARHFFAVLYGAVRFLRVGLLVAVAYACLNVTLGLFPWTRGAARSLLGFVASPLRAVGLGLLGMIPDLIVLAIIVLLTRYALNAARAFFAGVESGTIRLASFDREWALPTYRIVRAVVIAFAAVVAYPYVPGSGSEAFKGISIFAGVVLSLGSSSVMASIIAGYAMTYRRAFRVGDRVRIAGVVGDVLEMRLMVTRLRTVKNEEVVIPNSAIQNEVVVNYSALARERGLILHTTVGIGYETPWRQVEAMLLMAAARTPGVLREPAPFVLQQALGDFAVTYELNVYCEDPHAMAQHYTELHRNILDVFNEYGVQIMTPAYESDPAEPKLVPPDRWFEPPARRPDGGEPNAGGKAEQAGRQVEEVRPAPAGPSPIRG